MKLFLFITVLGIPFFVTTVTAQQIVYDPSAMAQRNLQAVEDKAFKIFTENKWVENIRVLYQNYNSSKDFYDEMTRLSKHRGGLVGHWQERAQDRLENAKENAVWRFESYVKSDPADTAYVKNWMTDMDKTIINSLDYSKQIRDLGKKQDKKADEEMARKTTPGSDGYISPQNYDSAALLAAQEQIRQLRIMNDHLAMLLKREQDKEAREWAAERAQRIEDAKTAKSHADAYKHLKKKDVGSKKDPWAIFQEVPK